MDHHVSGGECQRIHLVAALDRRAPALGGGHPVAREIGLGDEHQSGHVRAVARQHQAVVQRAAQHPDRAANRFGPRIEPRCGYVVLLKPLEHPLPGAGTCNDDRRPPAGGYVRAQVREEHRQQFLGPAHLRRRLHVEHDLGVGARRQRAQRPPRPARRFRRLPHPGQRAVCGGGQVHALHVRGVQRRGPAERGRGPRRLEELLAGAHQVRRAGADLLRIAQQHVRTVRHDVGQQLQFAGLQHRQQRLHALDRNAGGHLVEHLHQGRVGRVVLGEARRAFLDLLGQQQFPAGRGDEGAHLEFGDGPLVGDGERAQLGDLVTPELDSHRVVRGRREDVEDAAAHRELAALADHVGTGVGQLDEPLDQLVEVVLRADTQGDGLDVAQTGGHRLHQRAHGRDDHPQLGSVVAVLGVREPAQHL